MRPRQKIAAVLWFSTAPLLGGLTGCAVTEEQHGEQLDEIALIELRGELLATQPSQALERMDHFRPLCDQEGYPLVGNVATKSIGLQPSQFCAEVRD